MKRDHLVIALFLLAVPWQALGQTRQLRPDLSGERTSSEEKSRLQESRAGLPGDRAQVERTIHDNICWALTKDRALLERTMAHDGDLFIFNPDSKPTIGWDELAKNFTFWMDPRFKAVKCDFRDLRIGFSPSRDAAWWSAVLDDLAEWDGKPTGWKDTRWTGVLEKRNGAWVIVQMHFSFAADKVRAEALASVKKQATLTSR